ncbi:MULTISPECIES: hypothetical protein [Rhizobium]|uniref:Uncharacterized protein n=1 Tax=Rhizobium paranaense TaxID=1650438 RepID=A0A7W9D2J7_9HYPH|nr:hypothetical protein [Rhizobium paranaense]MBB5575479.1 hypothetical protein [Rhizobium paranaense]
MISGKNNLTHLSALQIVEVRFPDEVARVQQLFSADETFRSMCEDLAAAVETLTRVDYLPDNVREVRRQEYAGLVEALTGEIRDALRNSKIVILRAPSARPKS